MIDEPVDEREQRLGLVAGCQRDIFAETQHVEPIDEVVVGRVGARLIDGALEVRTRQRIERPPLGAVLTCCLRAVQRCLALATIEARELSAG